MRRFRCSLFPAAANTFPLLFSFPLLLIHCPGIVVFADLPQELDPFLERLFETSECESFLADSSFLAVSTRECSPTVCDFPRQLCMRMSGAYKDERANQCRALPEECLIAANGGQPLPTTRTVPPKPPPATPPPQVPSPAPAPSPPPATEIPPAPSKRVGDRSRHGPLCEQGPPEGRFCGFALKFAFNRETRSCDQFWFPGCRTPNTNENLFDSLGECLKASRHCARADPIMSPDQQQLMLPAPSPAVAPSPGGPPLPLPQQPPPPPPDNAGGGGASLVGALGGGQWQNSQAGQFIRMISNTIREVRERGAGHLIGGGTEGTNQQPPAAGGGGFRFDPSQLGGLLQSFGKRR